MESVLPGIYLLVVGAFIGIVGYIIKDWFKSGRVEKGEYLTVEAFNQHKRECCILDLKKSFNLCQQDSCTVQADHASRIKNVEEKLRDGQVMFQVINERIDEKFDLLVGKFDRLNESIGGIQATLKFAIDRERKENGF